MLLSLEVKEASQVPAQIKEFPAREIDVALLPSLIQSTLVESHLSNWLALGETQWLSEFGFHRYLTAFLRIKLAVFLGILHPGLFLSKNAHFVQQLVGILVVQRARFSTWLSVETIL